MLDLRYLLSSWMQYYSDFPLNEQLGYLLDTRYPAAGLSHRVLEERDHHIVTQLEEACKDAGFCICLANMTREVEGHDGENGEHLPYRRMHSMIDVTGTSLTLDRIVNLDGTVPFDTRTLFFQEDDIVQEGAFQFEDPDDEDHDAYYGLLSHVYHKTVGQF